MKKMTSKKNIGKKVIGLVAAAVMSVSMFTVGGMTASAASEYQNKNFAVIERCTEPRAVVRMTVYVSPEWQQADATYLLYIWNSQSGTNNVVSVDSIEGTKCQFKYAYGPDFMKVLRCKPGTTAQNFSWDKVWNETDDIKIADLEVENEYTIQRWEKDHKN